MSQRPPASRPASRSPPDGQRRALPPVQLRDDTQHGVRPGDPQPPDRLEGQRFAPQPVPSPSHQYGRPLQPAPPGDDWRLAPFRDVGVHSMLNPTEPESSSSSGRRVSGGDMESPLSSVGQHPFGASPSTAPLHTFSNQQPAYGTSATQSNFGPSFQRSRTMLTPRSPRSISVGRGRATIDATRSPFLPPRNRAFTAGSGLPASSDVPSILTPGQTQNQQQYSYPSSSSPPRRGSSIMQAPIRTPLSQSTSPSISQSSQNLSSSQTSPASFPHNGGPPSTTQGYFSGPTFAQAGGGLQFGAESGGQAGSSSTTEGPYSAPPSTQPGHSSTMSSAPAASGSRQTSVSDPIQLLTITTSQGIYNVPVDVHQASRLADEKRARNAGASARFRQRRKEKEREANTTIEKMQSQSRDLERKVRELEEERDFYREERNRFRDVMMRTPDMRHLVSQAPPSPQSMRATSFQVPPPPQHISMGGYRQDPPQERAPRRRRTGTSGEFSTLPPATTLPPVQSYSPRSTNLPPLRIENPNAHTQTTGPNVTPTTTSGPHTSFESYARGPPGPHERGWPGERGGR